jgi:hypothetical protein
MTPPASARKAVQAEVSLSSGEARAIARDAYIYGFPLVDGYRRLHAFFIDRESHEFKGAWNTLHHEARIFTAADRHAILPDCDTAHSVAGLDLRREPLVLSVPKMLDNRYYAVEFNDLYTSILGYLGSRTTGNGTGDFMIAGPGWSGKAPRNVHGVLQCETELAYLSIRTQILDNEEIGAVRQLQSRFILSPLSTFLGRPPPVAPPRTDFLIPLSARAERNSLGFFEELNFVLQFCPPHASEKEILSRFARLNIGGQKTCDLQSFSPEVRLAIDDGMADAWKEYEALEKRKVVGELSAADLAGTRASLKNNYLYRMAGAVDSIWNDAGEEALSWYYLTDAEHKRLDANINGYVLSFPWGQLPPVNGFWSLTLYELPTRRLFANPLNRSRISSTGMGALKRDPDGTLRIHIRYDSPGTGIESNWLPAPRGPFLLALRMYWPKTEAVVGAWAAPDLLKTPALHFG